MKINTFDDLEKCVGKVIEFGQVWGFAKDPDLITTYHNEPELEPERFQGRLGVIYSDTSTKPIYHVEPIRTKQLHHSSVYVQHVTFGKGDNTQDVSTLEHLRRLNIELVSEDRIVTPRQAQKVRGLEAARALVAEVGE